MEWVKRYGYEVASRPTAPGIYRLKTGGYLVLQTSRDRRTGRRRSLFRALHGVSLSDAKKTAGELRAHVRLLAGGVTRKKTRFFEFAASLFERKVKTGELKSAKSIERWDTTLRIHLVPAFGDFWCDELRYADIEAWRTEIAQRFDTPARIPHPDAEKAKAGRVVRNPEHAEPTTANGWLSILRIITKQMAAELELERDPGLTVKDFDTSTRPTYTDEAPNALTPEWARKFLEGMSELFPNHYAMTLLGFVTGLRPSSLRPLRSKGPDADMKWDTGEVLVRRSNSKGQAVMNATKTGRRQRIALPGDVVEVLKRHVAAFEDGPMRESELLFPARHGGMRARSVLDKPFRAVAQAIGLPFELTPRGMRRTNKDLMRAVDVSDVVSKAISGHTTDAMHEHYSTASATEVRGAIEQVTTLVTSPEAAEIRLKKKAKSPEEQ